MPPNQLRASFQLRPIWRGRREIISVGKSIVIAALLREAFGVVAKLSSLRHFKRIEKLLRDHLEKIRVICGVR